jgi:hypothetical protein
MSERGRHAEQPERPLLQAAKRGVGVIAAGAAVLGVSSFGFKMALYPDDRRYVSDAMHHMTDETPTEARIADAIKQTFDRDVMVRCAPIPSSNEAKRQAGSSPIGGNTIAMSYYGYELQSSIRLAPQTCDTIMAIADRKQPYEPDSMLVVADSIVLSAAPHEAGHDIQGPDTRYEGQADCYAAQSLETFAVALNTSPEVADQLSDAYAENINSLAVKKGVPQYATDPDTCRPGGSDSLYPALDVALNVPTFPKPAGN